MARNYGFPFKKEAGADHTGEDHSHIGNKPGAEMTELNSSEEMRELNALDTGVEYATDESNVEWQRRDSLNKARRAYTESLGAPSGNDVMASEERKSALPKKKKNNY